MNSGESFGDWLKRRRHELDMTQCAFAKKVYCAQVTIRKIEAGMLRPSRQLAYLIVDTVGVPPEEREQFVIWARQRPSENSWVHTMAPLRQRVRTKQLGESPIQSGRHPKRLRVRTKASGLDRISR